MSGEARLGLSISPPHEASIDQSPARFMHSQISFAELQSMASTVDPSLSKLTLVPSLERISIDGCESTVYITLVLVILGLPDEEKNRLPLKQVSKTRWEYEGTIQLVTDAPYVLDRLEAMPDLTIILVSDTLGDIGIVTLPAAELNIGNMTMSMGENDAGGQIKFSAFVQPCVIPTAIQDVDDLVLSRVNVTREGIERFQRTAKAPEIDKAIRSLQGLLRVAQGHSSQTQVSTNLSWALFVRFQVLGHLEDIDDAISAQEATISGSKPPSDSTALLGLLLRCRFGITLKEEDFNRARGMVTTDDSFPHAAGSSQSFEWDGPTVAQFEIAEVYLSQLEAWSGKPDHGYLSAIVELYTQASRRTWNMRPRSLILRILGNALCIRSKCNGRLDDIDKAISYLTDGVDAAYPGDPFLCAMLTELGRAQELRWAQSGELIHLTQAISTFQRSIQLTPPNHCRRPYVLRDLGLAMLEMFKETEETVAGYEALHLLQSGMDATPVDNPMRIYIQANLFSALTYVVRETDDQKLLKRLNDAAQVLDDDAATAVIPSPSFAFDMGSAYSLMHETVKDIKILDLAILYHRTVEDAIPVSGNQGHLQVPNSLALGNILVKRFEKTWNFSDINEAISKLQQTLDTLTRGHVLESSVMMALSQALFSRFSKSDVLADRQKSTTLDISLASLATGATEDRLDAAQRLGVRLSTDREHYKMAIPIFGFALELMSVIASSGQTVQRRRTILAKYPTVVIFAVRLALDAKQLDKALEWFEQGRGLIWSQVNSLRAPLDDLKATAPKMAERLQTVSRKLDGGHGKGNSGRASQVSAAMRVELAKEREQLLKTIRTTIPGFEHLHRPLPCRAWMENLPKSGPVIILNMHPRGCDAIALLSGNNEPLHIPLPAFTFRRGFSLVEKMRHTLDNHGLSARGLGEHSAEGDSTLLDPRGIRPCTHSATSGSASLSPIEYVLRELWLFLVKPILDALAISRCAAGMPTTRIWWCPTHMLTFLPLHAAGIYSGKDATSVTDYAISSYIPTVAVLAERMKRPTKIPADKSGILLACVPNAPGASSIPGTTVEITSIGDQLKNEPSLRTLQLQGKQATAEAALTAMKNYSCAHFACHATQIDRKPLGSGFLFSDGRLKLSTILESELAWADLAFLSACQTSTGTSSTPEEAIHLAGGMLAAGYRGVIATMWSIKDAYAPKLAEDFYKDLIAQSGRTSPGNGEQKLDGSYAAYALHRAVKDLRGRIGLSEYALLSWVPYVHFGL